MRFLKQLFCKHIYCELEKKELYIQTWGLYKYTYYASDRECIKCKKRKFFTYKEII